MVKRIISGFLILVCITAVFCVPTGYAENSEKYTYKLCFEEFENGLSEAYSIGCTVAAPPVGENRGKAAKMTYSSSSDACVGPSYNVVSDKFKQGILKKVMISVDVLFDVCAKGNLRLISSEQIGSVKNGMYVISFSDDGTFTTSYTFTNQENWEKHKQYKTGEWYNFKVELDLTNQTFSFRINDDEITRDTKIITNSGTDMIDFLHARVNLAKNPTADSENGYVYVDDFVYYIPYSMIYSQPVIDITADGGMLNVVGFAPELGGAALLTASYENGVIKEADVRKTGGEENPVAEKAFTPEKGKKYKFFLFEDMNSLTPLCKSKSYYCYADIDYEVLKDKWREFLVGNDTTSELSVVSDRISSINTAAARLQNTMNKKSDAQSLWGASYDSTVSLREEYGKIYSMALAYGTKGQSLYADEALKEDIVYALDWMYNNRYGQAEIDGTGWKSIYAFDWWDWFVGAPKYLVDTMMIMHEELADGQIENYLSLYNHLCTFMCLDFTFDANINSRAYNMYGACILQEDDAGINKLNGAYDILFRTTDSGTGMYKDYSYIKHNMIPYTGLYGTGALLDRIVKIMSISGETVFELESEYIDAYVDWIFNAFEPLMFDAGVMSMVRGRGVDTGNEASDGLIVLESVLNMLDVVSDEDAYRLKMLVKRHFKGNRLQYAYNNLSLSQILKLESIVSDATLPEPSVYELSKIYYNMDRTVHHREDWSAGIAMSSERIANYESIDGVNKKGWYTGDGMLYLYTEPDQYNLDYFKYADPYRRPGTTVDSQEREEVSVAMGQEYFSGKDFVGGASMEDRYSVTAMELESFHNDTQKGIVDDGSGGDQPLHECDLTAKKAWFMFDEEIVCLGADINASKDYEVFTTVENRKIDSNTVTIDNVVVADTQEHYTENPKWAHIEGTGGYFFPNGGNLKYRKITNNKAFFEIWLTHGNSPKAESYAYAVLPLMTAYETAQYSESPKFEILSNTGDIQSVYHKELGISGYVFWKACEFDGITTSTPVVIMKKETEAGIKIVFSDPTHKQNDIQIALDGEYDLTDCSEAVSASVKDGKTIIYGDLSEIDGETLTVVIEETNR